MRFMVFMIPNRETYLKGAMPTPEGIDKMTKYNEALVKAGVLLAGDGLHPPAKGARVSYNGGKVTVTDGPFIETKEVIGGYWIWQCKSKEEAVEWLRRCPADDDQTIELRQIFDMSDFEPSPAVDRAYALRKANET